MNEVFKKIRAALLKYRLTFSHERQLQEQLAVIFGRERIWFKREWRLSLGDRPDFRLRGEVAVEVKVGGSIEAHLRQLKRYNDFPAVTGTIFIATKPFSVPATLSGKPVMLINVGGNRL